MKTKNKRNNKNIIKEETGEKRRGRKGKGKTGKHKDTKSIFRVAFTSLISEKDHPTNKMTLSRKCEELKRLKHPMEWRSISTYSNLAIRSCNGLD
jgi:hypothetical protein